VIEAAMFIALGFFLATLLSIAIIPAIYKRAVRLTQEAMKAVNPTSYAEVRGAQDHVRAQHAVELRKVERALEQAQEDAAHFRTKAGKLTGDLLKQKVHFEAELETVRKERDDLEKAKGKRAKLVGELTRSREKLEETEQALAAARAEIDMHKEEDKEKGKDANAWLPGEDTMALATITGLESQIATLKAQLAKYESGEISAGDIDLTQDAEGLKDLVKELEGQLVDAETKYISAQAEVTRLTLQMDLADAPRDETMERMDRDLKWAETEKARLTALARERERVLVRAQSRIRRLQQDLRAAPELKTLRDDLLALGEKIAANSKPAPKRESNGAKAAGAETAEAKQEATAQAKRRRTPARPGATSAAEEKANGKIQPDQGKATGEAGTAEPVPVSALVSRIVKSSQANSDRTDETPSPDAKTKRVEKDKKRDVA
jgi:hypothetical protein